MCTSAASTAGTGSIVSMTKSVLLQVETDGQAVLYKTLVFQ